MIAHRSGLVLFSFCSCVLALTFHFFTIMQHNAFLTLFTLYPTINTGSVCVYGKVLFSSLHHPGTVGIIGGIWEFTF